MDSKGSSRIDELNREMYERDFKSQPLSPHQRFSSQDVVVDKAWQHDVRPPEDPHGSRVTAGSFFKKILVFSLLFFLISAGLLVYMFFGGWNIISSNRVDITFLGPVTISAGSELAFDVVINNQNRSAIENATLYIDYPDGTKRTDDLTQELSHEKEVIGEILSKGTTRRTSRSVQFGELNARREIKVALEYGLKNSNAKFRKEKTYDVTISSTPLTIQVAHPLEAVSNDTVEFKATITSNSSVPLNNVLIKADYPFGFAFIDANPKPTYDNAYWFISTLNPGESREITLRGQVQGEQGDERVIRFSIGAQSSQNEKSIATRYLTQVESVFLRKPPVGLMVSLDGSTLPTYTTKQGSLIQGTIEVSNNLPTRITDTAVKLSLKGQLLNPTSVTSVGGFYRSVENAIVWDKATFGQLASLEPGAKVNLNFSFSTLPASAIALKNGSMTLEASFSGTSVTDTASEKVTATQKRTIITKTTIGLLSRAVYSVGPFRNRGPIPPKVDTKTTYTIIWTATNSLNDTRGAEVRATLPVNVTWLGVVSPQSEVVTWNKEKNEVIWRIGDLPAQTGSAVRPAREVAFQVEFTPSLSQVDTAVTLIPAPTMTAIDSFTNTTLTTEGREVTTRLSTDPKYKGEEANVRR